MGIWAKFKMGLKSKKQVEAERQQEVYVPIPEEHKSIPISQYQNQVYQEELSKSAKEEARKKATADAQAKAHQIYAPQQQNSHPVLNWLVNGNQQPATARSKARPRSRPVMQSSPMFNDGFGSPKGQPAGVFDIDNLGKTNFGNAPRRKIHHHHHRQQRYNPIRSRGNQFIVLPMAQVQRQGSRRVHHHRKFRSRSPARSNSPNNFVGGLMKL